jgi:sigma-E factor negative regulatory protein RseA
MSEPLNEQLSAFIDGELPGEEGVLFVRRVPRDAELRSAASRYSLIGQAIRAEQSSIRRGFTARVIAAVARETTATGVTAGVTAGARNVPRSSVLAWWKPVAGIAVAASVAIVAILIVQNQQGARDLPQVAGATQSTTAAAAARTPAATSVSQIDTRTGTSEPTSYTVPPKGDGPQAPLAAARLASYVFAHSEYSSLPGRRNVVSDAAVQDNPEDSPRIEAPAP